MSYLLLSQSNESLPVTDVGHDENDVSMNNIKYYISEVKYEAKKNNYIYIAVRIVGACLIAAGGVALIIGSGGIMGLIFGAILIAFTYHGSAGWSTILGVLYNSQECKKVEVFKESLFNKYELNGNNLNRNDQDIKKEIINITDFILDRPGDGINKIKAMLRILKDNNKMSEDEYNELMIEIDSEKKLNELNGRQEILLVSV